MDNNLILKEKLEPGVKRALHSNFSKYTDAVLELLDNSVSNRVLGRRLTIDVLLSSKKLTIIDKGGYGMGIKGLSEFLQWGKIKSRRTYDIGAYSQGGKSAMGYLGKSMIVITSPTGEKVQYRIEDDDLHDYTKMKEYRVMEIPADSTEGQTQIEIGELCRNIKGDILKEVITNTYRPLIETGEVFIKYNTEKMKVKPFPLDNSFKRQNFSFFIGKNLIKGWVGRLASKSGIKGGMRCYKLGRLICDKEFFSKYDASYKQTLNYLFGEVHLDHITAITNKTNFDRDSQEWIKAKDKVFEILKPHIDDLLGREIVEPTDEEKLRIKEARDIVAELMKMRDRELKGGVVQGEAFGQKPRETGTQGTEILKLPIHVRNKYQPRTPPPEDAKGRRRRLNKFMDWDIRHIDESVRSFIEDMGGGKILVINNLFPGFKASKGHQLYLIETAALQLSQPDEGERITVQEYLNFFDELYSYFCSNLEVVKEKLNKKKR